MNIRYGDTYKIPRKAIKYFLNACYWLVIKIWPLPKVLSIDETLDKIITDKCSISRFGDGEFLYIIDRLDLPFQQQEPKLRQKLIEILKSDNPIILVGLPIGYHSLSNLTKENKLTWRSQISWIYPRLRKYISVQKTYYNASMTRPYADYENKNYSEGYFKKLMKIWEGREVLIVEGEKSRLGVGNNLFESTLGIRRILAPMHNAFSKYGELVLEVNRHDKAFLVLIALGPTATCMAFDLAKEGYQAIDIGNVDIEYEWYLRNAKEKVKIPGKYTSEAKGGRVVEDITDMRYESQVVARII